MSRKYLSFVSARRVARNLKLTSEHQWRRYSSGGLRSLLIPSAPCRVYKNLGWRGWGDWLGNKNVKYGQQSRLSFDRAYLHILPYIKKHNIDTQEKWHKNYKKIWYLGAKIPAAPDFYYKDSGWVSWTHWLRSENRSRHRKYKVDDQFFRRWSHNMAYILGFWWADGNISDNTFTICQHKRDKYILNAFRENMGSTCPLSKYKNCYIMPVYSRQMVADIVKLGGKENKSMDVPFPDVPYKYLPDFIRGYFDGDGCVYQRKNGRFVCTFVCGSKEFLETIYQKIKDTSPYIGGYFYKENKYYRLSFGSADTARIAKFIYSRRNGELRLHRKYNKMMQSGVKYKKWNFR